MDEQEVITLSDDDSNVPSPAKKVKTESVTKTDEPPTNGLVDHGQDNGKFTPNGLKVKKTARKAMSSFTPKLTVPELVSLDEDENIKPEAKNGHQMQEQHEPLPPEFLALQNLMNEFMGNLQASLAATDVEKKKVSQKFEKRMAPLKSVAKRIVLKPLIKKLKRLNDETERNILTVNWPLINDVLEEFKRYQPRPGAAANAQENPPKQNGDSGTHGPSVSSSSSSKPPNDSDAESDRKAAKRKRHLKKLDDALRNCEKEIKKLEEKELSLDELEDECSPYILVERYKRKAVKIHAKIQQLQQLNPSLGRRCDKVFKTETSRFPEINARIGKIVNKEKRFPDYHDILTIHKVVYEEKNLAVNDDELQFEARNAFTEVGKALKSRRIADVEDHLDSYLPDGQDEEDPAKKDDDLKHKLDVRAKEADLRLNQVFNEFAVKQEETKEQPEEVDNSDVESDGKDEDEEEEEEGQDQEQDDAGLSEDLEEENGQEKDLDDGSDDNVSETGDPKPEQEEIVIESEEDDSD